MAASKRSEKKKTQQKQSQLVHTQPILYLIKKPCPAFTWRTKILLEIQETLQMESKSSDTLSLVIITGVGGIGKTQTARKYASDNFPSVYNVVISFDAETIDSLRSSFLNAARATTTTNLSYDQKEYQTNDKITALAEDLYSELAKNYGEQKILLIFDNALQFKSTGTEFGFGFRISQLLPNPTTYGALFHVLVTSQNQIWSNKQPHTFIRLGTLDDIDAVTFLKDSFRQKLTDEMMGTELETELSHLQESLDGFPLGISVAAADILDGLEQDSISQDDLTTKIQNYVTDFEALNEPLKFESESHESDYGKMMTKVLNLAISRIRNKQAVGNVSKKAIQLLHMMSYLSPDGIYEADCNALFYSQEWVLFNKNNEKTIKDRNELSECFQILKNMSLITLKGRKNNRRGRSIQLHRLVQKITRGIFKPNVFDLNCWFKPLQFILLHPFTHAAHVLQNICSTFQSNIPLVALASAYSVVVSNKCESLPMPIRIHERIKKVLAETEQDPDMNHVPPTEFQIQTHDLCPDKLQQDLKKFLYHIVCLREDHLTSNVGNLNAGHVTQVVEIMKTHVNDLWVQYIGIKALNTRSKRLFTQDEEKCVLDWMYLFFDTRYPQYRNYMKEMHDKALSCSLRFIAATDEYEGDLPSAEAYIKLSNDTKHSMDDKIESWCFFHKTTVNILKDDYRNASLKGLAYDVTRASNVFPAAVDIFARRLACWDQTNDFNNLWRICSKIIDISGTEELSELFWSSRPFMDAFLQRCLSSIKELEKIDALSDYKNILAAAGTLTALFAKAADEDLNWHVSRDVNYWGLLGFSWVRWRKFLGLGSWVLTSQMEAVLPSVLHRLGRLYHEDKDTFNYTLLWLLRFIPLTRFKCFMRKHGEKDVWFVKVALAILVPAQFFSEDPAVRCQALQYVLSKQESDSEDTFEDKDDDEPDDEEDSESKEVSDEEEN